MLSQLMMRTALAASLAGLTLYAHAAEKPATDTLALQVALDRAGFSPGVIDGTMGHLTRQALRGFQEAKGLKVTGSMNEETKTALGELPEPTEAVKLTEADAAGPFTPAIPKSMADKAKLDGLHYTSIEEALAERYHTTPAKLRQLKSRGGLCPRR